MQIKMVQRLGLHIAIVINSKIPSKRFVRLGMSGNHIVITMPNKKAMTVRLNGKI